MGDSAGANSNGDISNVPVAENPRRPLVLSLFDRGSLLGIEMGVSHSGDHIRIPLTDIASGIPPDGVLKCCVAMPNDRVARLAPLFRAIADVATGIPHGLLTRDIPLVPSL